MTNDVTAPIPLRQRITIRIGQNTLSFSTVSPQTAGGDPSVVYEPYVVKSGISMAVNLREAFKGADLLSMGFNKARIMVDTPVLMVPVELFEESTMAEMYHHAFMQREQDTVLYNVLPDLNAVAVFAINRDLKTVIDDHFQDIRFVAALSPVWRYLHQRSFTGSHNKLFGYFHGQSLDIFAFQQNRFKFCNQYEVRRGHDAIYFLLYVWKSLALMAEQDELHLVGDIPEEEWLIQEIRKYLQKAYVINPTADFNRAPATQIKGMPYDLAVLFTKGR